MDLNDDTPQVLIEPFNSRELEVLRLLSNGLSNREIANRLYLSIDTIKWYNKQMFIKLGVRNRTQAAKKAAELNLLESEQFSSEYGKEHIVGNLPAQINSYIGREREIGEIKEFLKENRLIMLTGAGGSGKTRLALKVAEELQGSYSDGIWLVEFANIREPSQVLPEIANVFGITENTSTALGEVVKRKLGLKHLLLLLDNLEHLLDSAPLISELLAAAPQLSVLGTSRERLHIYGEQEYPVRPLKLPDPNGEWKVEELENVESIALFIKRAKAVNPNLTLDEKAFHHLARICTSLDGLPLAIELCAPMVKVFPLSVIAERIENDLDAIPEGPRDLPTRQQTLMKTFQWSLDLLKENEKRLFIRLAIFNGGSTFDAIESICRHGISGNIESILTTLVRKNLVLAEERRDGEIYFTMLETIRQFNQDRLRLDGELESLSLLHAEYFAQLAEQAHNEFSTQRHKYWFLRLKVEQNNIRAAMNWTLQEKNSNLGLKMVTGLSIYWNYYGFARETLQWIERALDISGVSEQAIQAAARKMGALLYMSVNEFERGRILADQALQFFRQEKDELNEAWTLTFLGFAHINQPVEIQFGIALINEGLDIFNKLNDLGGMAHALNILGEMYRIQGNLKHAKKCYQNSLELAQESGEMVREAIQYSNLGAIAYEEKEYTSAEKFIKQALSIFLELDANYGLSYHLASLAGPSLALGNPLRAARVLGASVAGMDSLESVYQHADKSLMDNLSKGTLEALDKEAFIEAFQEGQRMSLQEAIAYALSDADEPV